MLVALTQQVLYALNLRRGRVRPKSMVKATIGDQRCSLYVTPCGISMRHHKLISVTENKVR